MKKFEELTREEHKTVMENTLFTTYAWAQDFVKALSNRPKIVRVLLRVIFGKYAYREFIGMVDGFILAGHYFNYELEEQDYHKEKTRWDFLDGARRY